MSIAGSTARRPASYIRQLHHINVGISWSQWQVVRQLDQRNVVVPAVYKQTNIPND